MSTLAQTFISLADLYKRTLGEDGKKMAAVINLLALSNPLYRDLRNYECNLGGVHRHSIVTGLPDVSWGAIYEGVAQSKSDRQQVDDVTGFVEALSTIDTRILNLAKDKGAIRLQEAQLFLESMAQEVETSFFYADPATEPRKPRGMAPRYNTVSHPNVIDGGGTGSDNLSVWFITHGPNDTCGIYPSGTKAGVDRDDKGEQRVLDAAGNPYYVAEEMFTQHIGFAVKDFRNNSRVCNVDVSDLAAGTVDLHDLMTDAYYTMHRRRVGSPATDIADQLDLGRTMIYMNSEAMKALDKAQTNGRSSDNFVRLKPMELQGEEVMSWRSLPIRETDALLKTEARIT